MYERTLRFFINRFDYKRLDSDGTFCINYIPNLQSECWRHLSPQMFQTSLLFVKKKGKKKEIDDGRISDVSWAKNVTKMKKKPTLQVFVHFHHTSSAFCRDRGGDWYFVTKIVLIYCKKKLF